MWPGVRMTRTSIETPASPPSRICWPSASGVTGWRSSKPSPARDEVGRAERGARAPARRSRGRRGRGCRAPGRCARRARRTKRLVPVGVPARVDDHGLAARDDHVGKAALAAAVDLPELEARGLVRCERHPHGLEVDRRRRSCRPRRSRRARRPRPAARRPSRRSRPSRTGRPARGRAAPARSRRPASSMKSKYGTWRVSTGVRGSSFQLSNSSSLRTSSSRSVLAAVEPRQQRPHLDARDRTVVSVGRRPSRARAPRGAGLR